MRRGLSYFAACALAALSPLWAGAYGARSVPADRFPGWPTEAFGRAITPRALGQREALLADRFPGRVGRFHDGRDEWIVRWIAAPTRELHSAADCYRALGYAISGEGVVRDAQGREWGAFDATTRRDAVRVLERYESADGLSWTDRSAWYWDARTGAGAGPWWAWTRVTPRGADHGTTGERL